MVGSSQKITELCQDNDEGCTTKYMSVIRTRVPETHMQGQRCISRRPLPSIHTQLQTTAEDNI